MQELNRQQIQQLVNNFYTRVQNDEVLGPVFNTVAAVNWTEHISLLTQFWSSVMLGTSEYSGNPMRKHLELSAKTELTAKHFAQWLEIFNQEAKSCLSAEAAELIIARASLIARAIQQKLCIIPNH